MERYEFVCPCHFGLEAVLKKEIQDLGYEIVQVEDGKVTFAGDVTAFARANVFLRTTERVLWKVGSFHAETFEELFQGTKAIPWEEIIPVDGKFWVTKANSVKSKLFSQHSHCRTGWHWRGSRQPPRLRRPAAGKRSARGRWRTGSPGGCAGRPSAC